MCSATNSAGDRLRPNLAAVEIDTDDRSFLGVTKSARGFAWRERLPAHLKQTATAISQRHGLPDLIGRVLAARGIGLDAVPTFLDPSLKALNTSAETEHGSITALGTRARVAS